MDIKGKCNIIIGKLSFKQQASNLLTYFTLFIYWAHQQLLHQLHVNKYR